MRGEPGDWRISDPNVIKKKEEHVQEMLEESQEARLGGTGTHIGMSPTGKGRRVSGEVMKNSELLSPAMKKKLGSSRIQEEKKREKKNWG